MDINVIIASTVGLFVITLLLVTMLLIAKEKLLPSGPVKLVINGEKDVEVSSGDTLLTTLGNNKIFLPSACGGGGTCVQCRCQVIEGVVIYYQQKNLILQEKKSLKAGDSDAKSKSSRT